MSAGTEQLSWPPVGGDRSGVLPDPHLNGQPPTSLSLLLIDGDFEIIYRWYQSGAWVTAMVTGHRVTGRHAHLPWLLFSEKSEVSTKMSREPYERDNRSVIWYRDGNDLTTAIRHTQALHAQVGSALESARGV